MKTKQKDSDLNKGFKFGLGLIGAIAVTLFALIVILAFYTAMGGLGLLFLVIACIPAYFVARKVKKWKINL